MTLHYCHSGFDPEYDLFNLDSRFRGNDVWIPACAGMTEKKEMTGKKGMMGKKGHALVIPAVFLVIPAKAGIQVTGQTGWIPAFAGTTSSFDTPISFCYI